MGWLLNLTYAALLLGLSPWLAFQAWRHGKYREGWAEKFLGNVRPRTDTHRPCVWLHAVSLGEVNLLSTLVAEISRRRPDVVFYLTTTTRTGYDAACRRYPEHQVSYCPLDFTWAVRRAIKKIRPDMLVLAELELWPNLITEVHRSGAKVCLVNARLSAKSFAGYRKVRLLMRRLLSRLELIAAQDPVYVDRFRQLGARDSQLHLSGSLKFDGAKTKRDVPAVRKLLALANIGEADRVWLAGSTFPPEEEMVIAVFRRLMKRFPQLRLILVPRHPERFDEVAEMLNQSGLRWTRRSQLPGGKNLDALRPSNGEPPSCVERVVLVDTTGELGDWWGTSDIGFVGGSFGPRGGQNMIEPAAYGTAVCFGPKTGNFRDVVQMLLGCAGAVVVNNQDELLGFIARCIDEPHYAAKLGAQARGLVKQNLGATKLTVDLLLSELPRAGGLGRQRRTHGPAA